MADLEKMDRTWLCSVLFMDIVNYSSQSVDMQVKWKTRFNGYLEEAIRDVPESERVILDTGDGAAVCFLGAPEAAMFAAFHLWRCFVSDERDHQPGLRVRTGVNLGPVRLLKDINGALNALGDGINAGQRIMSFAVENQILVSQSYFEVVSRLSDDYKVLFKLKGVETDKHIREHTVYNLLPPGSAKSFGQVAGADVTQPYQPAPITNIPAAPPVGHVAVGPEKRSAKGSRVPLLVAGAVAICAVVLVAVHFAGSGASKVTSTAHLPEANGPASADVVSPAVQPSDSKAIAESTTEASTPAQAAVPSKTPARRAEAPANGTPEDEDALPAVQPAQANITNQAKAAYDEGIRLIEQKKPAEALRQFDSAVRTNPNFVLAYLGRAQARRLLGQYETSIGDCNRAMKINPEEFRVYFCRALGEKFLKQYDLAVRDYSETIRLKPKFAPVYEMRGEANLNLRQYGRALEDLNRAILLKPNNAPSYLKRAAVYEALMQYKKAIQDYDHAILLQPRNHRSYDRRANAKKLSGDSSGAAADERYAQQLKEQ
jgi:class 3 adenylate cyclase